MLDPVLGCAENLGELSPVPNIQDSPPSKGDGDLQFSGIWCDKCYVTEAAGRATIHQESRRLCLGIKEDFLEEVSFEGHLY